MKNFLTLSHNLRNWLLAKGGIWVADNTIRDYRPALFFVLCIFSYFAFLIKTQPDWVLSGEMWAEMATNYYPIASDSSLFVKLFATDAGYIPLPQRLIALIGNLLHLPAANVSYFYTWSAMFATGSMVGVICLKPFRNLIRNDFFRLLIAAAVLLIADFESRTFINFTYFAGFTAAIVTALAFVNKSDDVPRWAWFIPVLLTSKPAVLAALPAMIAVAIVSRPRFRRITLTVTILCVAQVIRMLFSNSEGVFVQANDFSAVAKLNAAIRYFIGFLGAFSVGKGVTQSFYLPTLYGILLLFICLLTVFRKRDNSGALILVGLALLFFNTLLNCFALSDSWNLNLERLNGAPLYRHIIVGYFGVTLVIAGLIASGATKSLSNKFSFFFGLDIGPLVFFLWFVISGWFSFVQTVNTQPEFPVIFNSQWQSMAHIIDSDRDICVPVDPYGWIFQRNCLLLNPTIKDIFRGPSLSFKTLESDAGHGGLLLDDIPPQPQSNLISLALLIRPNSARQIFVHAKAILKTTNGADKYLIGSRHLAVTGGLVTLWGRDATPLREIESITLQFSNPINLAYSNTELGNKPVVIWLGN